MVLKIEWNFESLIDCGLIFSPPEWPNQPFPSALYEAHGWPRGPQLLEPGSIIVRVFKTNSGRREQGFSPFLNLISNAHDSMSVWSKSRCSPPRLWVGIKPLRKRRPDDCDFHPQKIKTLEQNKTRVSGESFANWRLQRGSGGVAVAAYRLWRSENCWRHCTPVWGRKRAVSLSLACCSPSPPSKVSPASSPCLRGAMRWNGTQFHVT
jgi:hypothetical protein